MQESIPHSIGCGTILDSQKCSRRCSVSPPRTTTFAENLVRFIRLNEGKLGRKRREGEFEKLTDDEVASIEAIVREAFEGFES